MKQFSLVLSFCAAVSTVVNISLDSISTASATKIACSGNGWIDPNTDNISCICHNGYGGDECDEKVAPKVPVASGILLYIATPSLLMNNSSNGSEALDGTGEVNPWASQFSTTVTRLDEKVCSLNATDTEGCVIEVTGDYTLIYSVYGNEGKLVTSQFTFKPESGTIVSIESQTKQDCVSSCYHTFGKTIQCGECYEPLGAGFGWAIPFNYNVPNKNITADPFQPREKDDLIEEDSSVASVITKGAGLTVIPTCLWIILNMIM